MQDSGIHSKFLIRELTVAFETGKKGFKFIY